MQTGQVELGLSYVSIWCTYRALSENPIVAQPARSPTYYETQRFKKSLPLDTILRQSCLANPQLLLL